MNKDVKDKTVFSRFLLHSLTRNAHWTRIGEHTQFSL